jgi:hypothetical protein
MHTTVANKHEFLYTVLLEVELYSSEVLIDLRLPVGQEVPIDYSGKTVQVAVFHSLVERGGPVSFYVPCTRAY